MRKVYAIGETVYDIIFKNGHPVAATPGGSVLNAAVSLGRLGLDVCFISEYGKDAVGDMIDDFLHRNGVNTQYACRYENFPSSLALAFLNADNNATYNFYKQYPQQRLNGVFPEVTHHDIVLFGSFYGIDPAVHIRLKPFLEHARARGAVIIYDPNFRTAHLSGMNTYRPVMMENFAIANIIKGSDEDFMHIFRAHTAGDTWQSVRNLCDMLVYTANKNNVHVHTPGISASFSVPPIHPVSTIGAGDTFNAGLIYGLLAQQLYQPDLKRISAEQCAAIVEIAIRFAGHVCMSYDNYLSTDFAQEILRQA